MITMIKVLMMTLLVDPVVTRRTGGASSHDMHCALCPTTCQDGEDGDDGEGDLGARTPTGQSSKMWQMTELLQRLVPHIKSGPPQLKENIICFWIVQMIKMYTVNKNVCLQNQWVKKCPNCPSQPSTVHIGLVVLSIPGQSAGLWSHASMQF